MASSGYYSHCNSSPSKNQSSSFEISCRLEESKMGVVVPGAWPMSQPVQFQNSNANTSVQRRNSPSKGASNNSHRPPRPMSMPSHHFHTHATALATLNSYCLESDDVVQYATTPSSVPPRISLANTESIPTPPPNCAPWIPKVKAIKKLQSKIGMGSEEKTPEYMNTSPLRFHSVHGDNIQMFQGGTAVRRLPSITHGYCKAIVFSDRPVKVNERVSVKVIGSSTEFAGGIRFGFTNQDPSSLRYSLPDRAIPELAKRQGFWAKALLADNLLKNEAILFYYVNPSGKVRYGINGKKVGTFLKYVDTRRPLWALLDVYGNTTAIELVDPKAHLNNSRKSLEEFNKNIDDVDSALGPSINSLNIRSESKIIPTKITIQSRPEPGLNNLQIHPTCGKNVQLNKFRNAAWRSTEEIGNAYIFTSRPLHSGETIVINVQQFDEAYPGSMAFGLTSADPESINPKTLPSDSYYLVDRPEYWIFKKDAVNDLESGDELAFTLTSSGAVNVSKNGGPSSILMYVDNSGPLYAFFDLFGSTYKIALIGSILPTALKANPREEFSQLVQVKSLRSTSTVQRVPVTPSNFTSSPTRLSLRQSPHAGCKNSQHLREGRSLSLSPSKTKGMIMNQMQVQAEINLKQQVSEVSIYTPLNVKQMDHESETTSKCPSPQQCKNKEAFPGEKEKKNWSVDCVACCKRPVNSLFSPCGHLTMCYDCAHEYWNSRQSTCCPICRVKISDVIRVSKSS